MQQDTSISLEAMLVIHNANQSWVAHTLFSKEISLKTPNVSTIKSLKKVAEDFQLFDKKHQSTMHHRQLYSIFERMWINKQKVRLYLRKQNSFEIKRSTASSSHSSLALIVESQQISTEKIQF